jgi:hypothetical protein
MKLIKIIMLLLIVMGIGFSENSFQDDACVSCHLEVDEDLDVPVMSNMDNDIHIQIGLSCADCHGGDPTAFDDLDAAMWDDESFLGIIGKSEQPEVCGSCHSNSVYMRNYSTSTRTDQVDQYWTSRHGILLKSGDTINKIFIHRHVMIVMVTMAQYRPRSLIFQTFVDHAISIIKIYLKIVL